MFLVFALSCSMLTTPGDCLTAKVERVVDGDTVEVFFDGCNWLERQKHFKIRLEGIDAPEIRGDCRREKEKAKEAQKFLKDLIEGKDVVVCGADTDSFGRWISPVLFDGKSVGTEILTRGLAVPYGNLKRWCEQ